MVGPKVVQRLEQISIKGFEELRNMDAGFLCRQIAAQINCPGWGTHSMAIKSIENAINTARTYSELQ